MDKAFHYIERVSDQSLRLHLDTFGAVLVEGPKWCGKTTSSRRLAVSEICLADPKGGYQNRRLAQLDPAVALDGARPRLIDEWQEAPLIWDAVRYECDQAHGTASQFILTGSATPAKRDKPVHSGAGRIARVRMDTMTLSEMGRSSDSISLRALFEGASPHGAGSLDIRSVAEAICRGGWPVDIDMPLAQAMLISRSYIDTVAEEDIQEVNEVRHDPHKVRLLIASLARNESTLASKRTLLADTAELNDGVPLSESTLGEYVSVLRRMFFVCDIPAWSPALRSPVRIRSASKHHLADPSLAVAALGATPESLMGDLKTMGFLFESLVAHELIVYARAMDAKVMHYNDDTNLEVDLIVQARDGRWGAFEVKLGADQEDAAAANLNRLEAKMVKRGERGPSVKAVVVGVGAVAHTREDGVKVIPIDALTA